MQLTVIVYNIVVDLYEQNGIDAEMVILNELVIEIEIC